MNAHRTPLAFTLLLATSTALTAPAAPMRDPGAVVAGPDAERIDRFLTAAEAYGLAGTVLVEKDGRVILHKGYGIVDHTRATHADTRTPYLIGSLSKQFTAAAIYKLESQGKLHVTDSLGHWWPDAPADKRGITVDELIHHTAGLPYLPQGGLFDSITTDSMVREVLGYPLAFAPGARHQYSSPGYNLLAAIIARASGRSFDDYLRAELFVPAGMTESGFADERERWPMATRTPSYSGEGEDPPLYPTADNPKATGAGTVVTTCADLWKWEQALRQGTVLDAATTAKYFAPGPESSSNSRYAGGWQVVKSQRGTTVIMHGGDIGGFNADMRRFVDEHATLVFLSNQREGGRGYREAVSPAITRMLFGPPLDTPPARAALPASQLARWRGRWPLARGVAVEGRVHADTVWVLARSQAAMSALAGSDSASRAEEQTLNGVAAAVADTLVRNDRRALGARFHPALPEDSHGSFFDLWQRAAELAGPNPKLEVLGTAHTAPNAARSYVSLRGPKGVQVVGLDWERGLLIDSAPVPRGGFELQFFAERPDTLARLDLWSGRVFRVAKAD